MKKEERAVAFEELARLDAAIPRAVRVTTRRAVILGARGLVFGRILLPKPQCLVMRRYLEDLVAAKSAEGMS